MSALHTALIMAENWSIPIFPCKQDKRPYTEHGFKDATCNLDVISSWWAKYPDAMPGVPTGEPSHWVVIDVDPDGDPWYRENFLRLNCGYIRKTRRGYHLFYKAPAFPVANSAGKIAKGVDVRGNGGYVCLHDYPEIGAIEDLTELPDWLADLLREPQKLNGTHAPPDGAKFGEGDRHQALLSAAGTMRRKGLTGPVLEAALLAWNEANCSPPQSPSDVVRIARDYTIKAGDNLEIELKKEEKPPLEIPKRMPIDWPALEGKEPPDREWIIPHWIPAGHITLLAGRGGMGKTLIAQHLATSIAAGVNYLGITEPRRVLMWAGEDDERELWRRQQGISSYLGASFSALGGKFICHSYAGSDITLAETVFGQLRPTLMLKELREQVSDYKADLVILDNVARLFGGNENERHGVTTFIAWLQGAISPAAALLLAHPARAQGSEFSGSSAWEGAVRARLYLSDRPPDAKAEDDAPMDERIRYLSRRKANYAATDIVKFTLNDGVLIPEAVELRATGPSGEFAKDIVLRAITALAGKSMHGTASSASPLYLPRLAKEYGLLETLSEFHFGKVMRTMIMDGSIERKAVGQYPNRAPKYGLLPK